jgi:fumarate reductase subunit C
MLVFHAAALVYYLVYMTFDWFKLAPKAMPVQLGEKKLPDRAIVIGHYAAWAVVTLIVFRLAGVL